MKLVKVIWQDALGITSEWECEDALDTNLVNIETVGFIVRKDKEVISIASSFGIHPDGEKQITGLFNIPYGCVVKIKELEK